jgi:flagellar basal body-associated protein FliL
MALGVVIVLLAIAVALIASWRLRRVAHEPDAALAHAPMGSEPVA